MASRINAESLQSTLDAERQASAESVRSLRAELDVALATLSDYKASLAEANTRLDEASAIAQAKAEARTESDAALALGRDALQQRIDQVSRP